VEIIRGSLRIAEKHYLAAFCTPEVRAYCSEDDQSPRDEVLGVYVGKGGYLGGSTVIRAFGKLSGRKGPLKGALDAWVEEARDSSIPLPDGVRLRPLNSPVKAEKNKAKNKLTEGKKKNAANAIAKKSGHLASTSNEQKPNEPLPDYAELVKALREKYEK
jgi:hypothetical protein